MTEEKEIPKKKKTRNVGIRIRTKKKLLRWMGPAKWAKFMAMLEQDGVIFDTVCSKFNVSVAYARKYVRKLEREGGYSGLPMAKLVAKIPPPPSTRNARLSDEKWHEILKRVPPLGNETVAVVAKEYGVSMVSVQARSKKDGGNIRELANQLATIERKIEDTPYMIQRGVREEANKLKIMASMLSKAGQTHAENAQMLAEMAKKELILIEKADPKESINSLKTIAALTEVSNNASKIPLAILTANERSSLSRRTGGGEEEQDTKPRLEDWYK